MCTHMHVNAYTYTHTHTYLFIDRETGTQTDRQTDANVVINIVWGIFMAPALIQTTTTHYAFSKELRVCFVGAWYTPTK